MSETKPAVRPARPYFSSGPCAKHPGWSVDALGSAPAGRTHRAPICTARVREAIDRTRAILGVPDDYRIALVPASDTGAMEMSMWSMLGDRPVDLFAWDVFGRDWIVDAVDQLKLDAHVYDAPHGTLPPFEKARADHDIVFTWNGTTAGARVPNADWIADDREGIVICDATSAVFSMPVDWSKIDVLTYSWQKVMGGEAAHGMLILGPRAVARLESYVPPRPLPKIFRMTQDGKLNEKLFEGHTINTISMLCVEDYLDALKWAAGIGGLPALIERTDASAAALSDWIERTDWADFVVADPSARTTTSVCITFADPAIAARDEDGRREIVSKISSLLEDEGVAYDIAGHRAAPPCLRIWCGATVDAADIEALTLWLDWAYARATA